MSDRRLQLLCWDCHEPIEEATAEQVRANPHLPEWMSGSRTRVCVDCALKRIANEPLYLGPVTGGFRGDKEKPRES